MTFCKDACRSAAFNHLLFRIAYKCKDQPREKIQAGSVLWYAKTELISSEMSDAWGVCKVRKEVNALIEMGLIGKQSNPAWGVDRTKHFCFGSEQCQVLVDLCDANNICLVHLDLPDEVKHLIYLSLASDKNIKCSCENTQANDKSIGCIRSKHQMQMINPSDAFDRSIGTITKISTKTSTEDNNKEEGTYAIAHASPTPTPENDEPYVPTYDLDETPVSDSHSHQGETNELLPASDYEKPEEKKSSQLSTLSVSSPQRGAKVEKRAGSKSTPPKTIQTYYTLEGQQVREWTKTVTGIALADTAANARACNALGKQETMTLENYTKVQERIDADSWLTQHNVVVDVQELASEDSKWRWERWVKLVLRESQQKSQQSKQVPPENTVINYTQRRLEAARQQAPQKARA